MFIFLLGGNDSLSLFTRKQFFLKFNSNCKKRTESLQCFPLGKYCFHDLSLFVNVFWFLPEKEDIAWNLNFRPKQGSEEFAMVGTDLGNDKSQGLQ